MDSSKKILNAFGFSYFGSHVDAYYNDDNKLIKRTHQPLEKDRIQENGFCKKVWDANYKMMQTPNLWCIDTLKSNITTIDVDQPNNCDILDHLLKKCKFYVKTRKGYHFYFKNNDKIPRQQLCGVADFNTNLLFFGGKYNVIDNVYIALNDDGTEKVYETKKGKKVPLWTDYNLSDEFYEYKIIKADKLVEMDNKIEEWCLNLINTTTKETNTPKKRLFKEKKILEIEQIEKLDLPTVLNGIKCLSDNRFTTYDVWRNTLFICKNMNSSEEVIKALWERSKIGKYKNISYAEVVNHFNNQSFVDVEKSTFFNICRDNKDGNYDKYFTSTYDIPDFKYTEINTKFLDYDEINKYFGSDKLRVIKSRYGSGKTNFIKQVIINSNKSDRIIFLVMRRSLALSLANEFKSYGFINYLDCKEGEMNFKAERVIISLDSLSKISYKRLEKLCIKAYNTVFCDEFTSLLAHMSFGQMKEPENIFKLFRNIINSSNVSYFLDGDISNREVKYLKKYHSYQGLPLVNINKGRKYQFQLHYDEYDFIDKIECALKNKLNIVVACATSKFANDLYERFNTDYKCLLMIGDTCDKKKKKMVEANKLFKEYQLTIYTSTVSVGVDINETNHFDQIYGYFTNCNTVCAREFFQMLFRVRNPKSNDINILLGNTCVIAPHHKLKHFEDVIHSSFDIDESRAFDYIQLWNRWEDTNKIYNLNVFLYYCTIKGHTYNLDETKINKFKKNKEDDDNDYYNVEGCDIEEEQDQQEEKDDEGETVKRAEKIFNSELIDDDEYIRLTKRVSKFKASTEEKYKIEKFVYYKKFCLPQDIEYEEFKNYYRNLHILKAYQLFIGKNIIPGEFEEQFYDIKYKSQFEEFTIKHKHNYFKQCMNTLGLTKSGDTISCKDYENKIDSLYTIFNVKDFNTIFLTGDIKNDKRSVTLRTQLVFNNCGFDFIRKQIKKDGNKSYVYSIVENPLLKYYIDEYDIKPLSSANYNFNFKDVKQTKVIKPKVITTDQKIKKFYNN